MADLRIAVLLDEGAIAAHRAWAEEATRLVNNAGVAIGDLYRHLERNPPVIWGTFDPSVEIEDEP